MWFIGPFGRASPAGGSASRDATSGIVENPSQQEFDLGVGAPQLVGGPTSQRVVHGGVEAEQDVLAFGHRRVQRPLIGLLVQGAGIDDGLRPPVAAQHHEEIRDHGGLAFFVQVDDTLLGETNERHLHHADRPLDNA